MTPEKIKVYDRVYKVAEPVYYDPSIKANCVMVHYGNDKRKAIKYVDPKYTYPYSGWLFEFDWKFDYPI